jgi:hypothetical protein
MVHLCPLKQSKCDIIGAHVKQCSNVVIKISFGSNLLNHERELTGFQKINDVALLQSRSGCQLPTFSSANCYLYILFVTKCHTCMHARIAYVGLHIHRHLHARTYTHAHTYAHTHSYISLFEKWNADQELPSTVEAER